MGIDVGIAARWLDSFLQHARINVREREGRQRGRGANGCPINFIAHLIDHKNYSFISTKIAKSAKRRTEQKKKIKIKHKVSLNDNSAAIDIYKICMSSARELGKK